MNELNLEGTICTEYAQGTVQCAQCDYWGTMDGFIKPDDTKFILFVCPECESIERVVNPLK